jgi:hypothetical protein
VESGKEYFIDLSAYLIQGARDIVTSASPDKEVLARLPTQRGWRLEVELKKPSSGIVRMSTYLDGIVYEPFLGFVGEDCFNYQLTNGSQKSDYGTVLVTVL